MEKDQNIDSENQNNEVKEPNSEDQSKIFFQKSKNV